MASNPTISIVMPSYNSSSYIFETIETVLKQDFADFEIIVVDDCSQDDTVALLRKIDDERVRVVVNPTNLGPAETRNNGLRLARGRYIAFLDSDDLWAPHKLSTQLAFMRERDVAFTYTKYGLIDEDGRRFGTSGELRDRVNYKELLPHCIIRTSSVMYDTSKTGGIVMFPALKKRQDFAMFLALVKICGDAFLVDDELCQYRLRRNSVSSNKFKNIPYNWALYRHVEGLPLSSSVYYIFLWFFNSLQVNVKRKFLKLSDYVTRRFTRSNSQGELV